MPVQRVKSGLLAKLGNRLIQAHENHKNDTTELSNFGDLPANVEGVARLVECKCTQIQPGKQNAGQYMFYAAGTVVEPEFYEGIKVSGRRTQISEPLFDTPDAMGERKTFDDHLDHVYKHLRALGLPTADLEPDSLEQALEMLKETAPHFRFRTFKGKKQTQGKYKDQEPRVAHIWMGKCDYEDNVEPGEGVQDDSVAGDAEEAYSPPPAPTNGQGRGKAKLVVIDPPIESRVSRKKPPKASPPPDDLEFGDIASLVKKAKKGDGDAEQSLSDMAIAAGATEEEVLEADGWDEVALLIQKDKAVDEGPEEEEEVETEDSDDEGEESEESAAPEVEQVVLYRPVDRKTSKPVKKPIDCEVMAVDSKKQTVTLKSLLDGKTLYKLVAWSDIQPQE